MIPRFQMVLWSEVRGSKLSVKNYVRTSDLAETRNLWWHGCQDSGLSGCTWTVPEHLNLPDLLYLSHWSKAHFHVRPTKVLSIVRYIS